MSKKCTKMSTPLVVFLLIIITAVGISLHQEYGKGATQTVAGEKSNTLQTTGVLDTAFKDIVESKSYDALPSAIRSSLGYSRGEVGAVIYAEASLMTKASSFIINVADAISRLSGIVLGGTQTKKELGEAIQTTVAQEAIAATGGKVGEVVLMAYKINEYGQNIQMATKVIKGAKDAVSTSMLAATALSMVLDTEMAYINQNVDGGLRNIWQLNPFSTQRLKLYLVFVDAQKKGGLIDQRGVKYYYLNDKTQRYINYYTNLAGSKLIFKK